MSGMMLTEKNVTTEMSPTVCGECGTAFAIPRRLEEQRRRDHKTFYCPNGHSLIYRGKSKEEILQDDLERERRHQRTTLRLSAARGQVTKIKNRVAKGVCPCCNRWFPEDKMPRHLRTKHPGFVEDEREGKAVR